MLSSAASLLALAGLAPAISPVGRVLVVDHQNGPYFDIQSAVDAAQERDTLLVKPGNYAGFTIDDKGLNVVADTNAVVHVTSLVRVRNLAPKLAVVLVGLTVAPNGSSGADALDLENDLGSVRIESCDFDAFPAYSGGSGAIVSHASDACLTFTHVTSAAAYTGGSHPGLSATQCNLAVYDCEIHGGAGGFGCPSGYPGGDGVVLSQTFQFALRCRGYGGTGGAGNSGGIGCSCGADGADGGAGIRIYPGSVARLVGGRFVGGAGGAADCGGCGGCGGSDGPPGGDVVGGRWSMSSSTGRSLTVPNPVRELASFQVTVVGLPGDDVYLSIAGDTTFRPLSGDQGVLLLRDPQAPIFLGTIGPSGTLSTSFSFPDLGPGVDSRNKYLQAAVHGAAGTWSLTDLSSLVVLDRAF